jgi:hypothetical protein
VIVADDSVAGPVVGGVFALVVAGVRIAATALQARQGRAAAADEAKAQRNADTERFKDQIRHQERMAEAERTQRRREDAHTTYLGVVWRQTHWAHNRLAYLETAGDPPALRPARAEVVSDIEVRASHVAVNAFGSRAVVELSKTYERAVSDAGSFLVAGALVDAEVDEEVVRQFRELVDTVESVGDEIIEAVRRELGIDARTAAATNDNNPSFDSCP